MDKIYALAKELSELYKIMYRQVKPDVLYIMARKVRNVRYIESTLDRLLEIPTDESYELYILLCDYYATIDKEGAKFYLDSWDEIYGDDEPKVKERTID